MTEDSQLTIKEVARRMKCSHRKVRGLIKSGELEAHKFGGAWRIKLSDLPGEAVKRVEVDKEIDKIRRDADLAEEELRKLKARRDIDLINAGMTVEELREKELALGETLLEIERLMDNLAGVKKRLNLQFGQEFIERWNELAVYVNQKLGKDDRQENTSEGVE